LTVAQSGTRRLFFALWPPEAVRRSVLNYRDALGSCSGKPVPVHNYHLTLLFLGNQDAARLPGIRSIGDAIRGEPFELGLDHWGHFAGPRVAWLGATAPRACLELVAALESGVRAEGLDVQARPFVPHLTVFRKVEPSFVPHRVEPIVWDVSSFSLIESPPNRPYQVLRSWSLQ
jgi:2'-5' RNA ligase